MMIIDAPSPFAPLQAWKEFLAAMEALLLENPGDEDVVEAIAMAKQEIADHEGNDQNA